MNRIGVRTTTRKSVLAVAALAAALVTVGGTAAHATLDFYTERASFNAVVPGLLPAACIRVNLAPVFGGVKARESGEVAPG